MRKFLVIEGTDFEGFPGAGQTQQAMNVVRVFPERVVLVGISTDDTPVGKWIKKKLYDVEIDFFSVLREPREFKKPFIPRRLKFFFNLKRYRRRIQSIGLEHMLTQSPEAILATNDWHLAHICYWAPGLWNPLHNARYRWGRILAGAFERRFYEALRKVDIILASADEKKITEFVKKSRRKIDHNQIVKFPTRVDINIFKPEYNKLEQKKRKRKPVFISLGRLSKVKGWDFLLDAFRKYIDLYHEAQLVFIGDGEDRELLRKKVDSIGLTGKAILTGHQTKDEVLARLHAADLVLFGSLGEGWSVAMVEAIACGKTIVSTNVSGSTEMIKDGLNGYIIKNRDPHEFAEKMHMALKLENASQVSRGLAQQYSLESFKFDLERYWINRK